MLQNFMEFVVPGDLHDSADRQRRVRVLGVMAAVVALISGARAVIFPASGSAVGTLPLLASSAVSAVVVLGVRRRWSPTITGNLMGAVLFSTCLITSIYRGGVGATVLLGIGAVPLLMTFVISWRAGLGWLVTVLSAVLALAAAQSGGGLPANHSAGDALLLDLTATMAITVVLFSLGLAFEWARDAAVSDRERAERDRRVAEEDARLLRADRMSSIGLLAAGVGHEINNPLTAAMLNLEALEGDPTHEERGDLISEALEGVRHIQTIVQDLMAFSRVDPSEPQAFPVERAVQAALSLTRNERRHQSALVTDLQPVPLVMGDESRLVQVFVNLLLNGVHAVRGREGASITVRLRAEGGSVVAEVEDNGVGMGPRDQAQLFQPFFTTKPRGEGTGLGLSVSLSIVREMGGDILVESAPGEGATFRVVLPQARAAPAGLAGGGASGGGARPPSADPPRGRRASGRPLAAARAATARGAHRGLG